MKNNYPIHTNSFRQKIGETTFTGLHKINKQNNQPTPE